MGDKEEEISSQEASENAGDNTSNNKPAAEEAEMESLKQTLSDTNLSGADGSQSAPKDKTKSILIFIKIITVVSCSY